MKTKDVPFKELLSSSTHAVGEWLIEHADDIAGDTDGRTGLRIIVDYDWGELSPQITIERSYISTKATHALLGADDE